MTMQMNTDENDKFVASLVDWGRYDLRQGSGFCFVSSSFGLNWVLLGYCIHYS